MTLSIGIDLISATILAGQSLSSEADLGAKTLVGIVMPAAWTAASLTFQVSFDSGATWLDYVAAISPLTVAAGQYLALDPAFWRGVNAVKLRSGPSGAPVNQVAQAVLQLVVRAV